MARPPYIVSGANYLYGWCWAAITRQPRAEAETVRYRQREDLPVADQPPS